MPLQGVQAVGFAAHDASLFDHEVEQVVGGGFFDGAGLGGDGGAENVGGEGAQPQRRGSQQDHRLQGLGQQGTGVAGQSSDGVASTRVGWCDSPLAVLWQR